jgi:hypothetical protein
MARDVKKYESHSSVCASNSMFHVSHIVIDLALQGMQVNETATFLLSSRCTGLKHSKPTVLGPAIIVAIAALFIINLITIISLNSPCLI